MTWTITLLLCGGFLTLVLGAEALVRGAGRLAAALGISPLVIGLTVVAFGTSAPELAVSVMSAARGQADIAVGNVVGSNIFNVLFILGLSALITPLLVPRQLVRFEAPLMIGTSVLAWLMALDGHVRRWEGAVLFAGLLCYAGWQVVQARREGAAEAAGRRPSEPGGRRKYQPALLAQLGLASAGLGLLVLGSRWFVRGAVELALRLGIDEVVVGLTIVAAGTSLPEVATSVVAALRGQREIAVGNVVGSNIFNVLCVLGLTALVAPGGGLPVAAGLLHADMPFMLAVSAACLPIFATGNRIARREGAFLLFYYAAYTAYLVLTASGHAALVRYQTILYFYIVPFTAILLAVSVAQEVRVRVRSRGDADP